MTDQLTALRELVAKVEAGKPVTDIELVLALEGDHTGLPSIKAIHAAMAINGSRDAAANLHEDLVPGWRVLSMTQVRGDWTATIEQIAPATERVKGAQHPIESAARLLASLRALIAELEATQ